MPSKWIYFQSDGTSGVFALNTHRQARAIAAPESLFVYGGDVYDSGTNVDFAAFDNLFGDVRPWLAAIPGNHDWQTEDAEGYEKYWLTHRPPASRTSIDTNQVGPSRHHYPLSLRNGWLGILMDCGPDAQRPLTSLEIARFSGWLDLHGSRRVIVFLHHARLSRGNHGNNTAIDQLWNACFDTVGNPRVAAWIAGHNHNIGIYSPRSKGTGPAADPPPSAHGIADGIQIFINGAGGAALYSQGAGASGTMPDVFADDAHFGFLQIELTDSHTARVQNFATNPISSANAIAIGPLVTVTI